MNSGHDRGAVGSHGQGPLATTRGGSFAAWWMITVLLILNIVALVDRNIINLLVVPIQQDLQLNDVEMGIVLGPAFSVAYVVFGLPFGWAVDRMPRRWVIAVGSTIWSAAMIGCGLATNLFGLIVGRSMVGAGEVALSPAAFSMIGDRLPPHRLTTALAFYSMAPKLAQALSFAAGSILGTYAATHAIELVPLLTLTGWRLVLVMIGMPGLALTLLLFTFSEPARSRSHGIPRPSSASFVRYLLSEWRLFVPLLVAASLAATMYVSMLAWYPTFLTRKYGWDVTRYGPIMFWIGIASAGSVLAKGAFVDWLVRRGVHFAHLRFYFVAILIALPCAILAFTTSSPLMSMIAYGIADGLSSAAMLYFAATIQLYLPAEFRGRINAIFLMTITTIASGLGPLAVAGLTETFYADRNMIGMSLIIVVSGSAASAAIAITIALRNFRTCSQRVPA